MFTCRSCGVVKPESEFYKFKRFYVDGSFGWYRRLDCAACHKTVSAKRVTKKNLRDKICKALKEAPFRAMIRLAKEDPDIFVYIANKHPLTYRKYLAQERKDIIAAIKRTNYNIGRVRAVNVNHDEIWQEIEDELYRNGGQLSSVRLPNHNKYERVS